MGVNLLLARCTAVSTIGDARHRRALARPPPDMRGVNIIRGVAAYSSQWSNIWRPGRPFFMPIRQEAFGTVFQEAAAAGLPRIGTRINAIPEIVQEGQNGILVTPGDRGPACRGAWED